MVKFKINFLGVCLLPLLNIKYFNLDKLGVISIKLDEKLTRIKVQVLSSKVEIFDDSLAISPIDYDVVDYEDYSSFIIPISVGTISNSDYVKLSIGAWSTLSEDYKKKIIELGTSSDPTKSIKLNLRQILYSKPLFKKSLAKKLGVDPSMITEIVSSPDLDKTDSYLF